MRTRNFYFQNNSSATIPRRRNKRRTPIIVEPELRTIIEMVDNRTMEDLLQAPTEGYGEAIVISKINANHFEIKQICYNWFKRIQPPNSILTWEDLVNKFVNQFFPPSKTTHLKNEISRFNQRFEETFGEACERFKEMLRACPHHGFTELAQIDTFYNGLNDNDQDSLNAAAGENLLSKTIREALQIIENKSKVHYSRNKPNVFRLNTTSRDNASKSDDRIDKLADQISTLVDIFSKKVVAPASVKAVEESCVTCGGNHAHYNVQTPIAINQVFVRRRLQSSTSGTLPSNTIPNPKGEMKVITTRSGVAYEGPSTPTPKKVVEQDTEETTDKEQTNFQGSTAHIQPPVTPILEPGVPKTLPKPNIPYPSKLNDQNLREKATNQMEKFFQIFQDLHFDICFADALILMPKFASTIKILLTNKDKLFELAKIPLNENCSAMLLKKLPKKLGDHGKFLIPCDFSGMDVCHTLADLVDRSITRPKGVAEDVFVKVGKFHFLTDFVVVDFEADPRVPLILGRSFLRTGRALIDVYGEEITLRVNDEAVTFNLNQTTRYSSTYDDLSVNRIDIIDVVREDDFILEEIDAYLKDESILTEIDHADCDPKGDIYLIEKLLNNDSFQLPSMDLKQGEVVKAKSLIEEPPKLELKELPSHLECAYLEGVDMLPKITNIKGIDSRFCTYKILMEEDYKPNEQSKRRVNPKIHEVIKKEVIKLLEAGMIYPISNSPWVSSIHCVPKKGRITVVENENNELIPTRLVTGWRVCIDYRKLNDATRKDHFPLPFMDQMLERLAGNEFYCFIDGFSGYIQIPINPPDQEKTTFTCPYGTFAYRRMTFGLCNALGTFQRCMMAIFHDMIEKTIKVFMDDFLVLGDSFSSYLSHLDTMLQICEDTNLVLNLKKCHFMVKEGIVLGHKISKNGLEVDHSKVDVIAKLPYPTTVKGVRSFLRHVGFYRRFIQDFSKIARPMTHLLDKDTSFVFSKDCVDAFETLKKKLTEAPILVVPDWNLHFKLMHKAYWALKHVKFDLKTTGDHRKLQLNELRDQAYENSLIYKEKTKKIHDSEIKNRIFNVGDRVLLFNSHLKIFSGKLKTRWSGPFTITKVFPYGTVELSQPDGPNFKVNGHRVKHYFGGDVPQLVVPDLQTFPMDK
nr:DNA-directed DNA polymerase [Tanacetum cinerariifolium]